MNSLPSVNEYPKTCPLVCKFPKGRYPLAFTLIDVQGFVSIWLLNGCQWGIWSTTVKGLNPNSSTYVFLFSQLVSKKPPYLIPQKTLWVVTVVHTKRELTRTLKVRSLDVVNIVVTCHIREKHMMHKIICR